MWISYRTTASSEMNASTSSGLNRCHKPGSALHIGDGVTTRSGRTAVLDASRRHDSPSSTASALAVLPAVSRNKTPINLQPRTSPIRWYGQWGRSLPQPHICKAFPRAYLVSFPVQFPGQVLGVCGPISAHPVSQTSNQAREHAHVLCGLLLGRHQAPEPAVDDTQLIPVFFRDSALP